jgi:hypothetical protein
MPRRYRLGVESKHRLAEIVSQSWRTVAIAEGTAYYIRQVRALLPKYGRSMMPLPSASE